MRRDDFGMRVDEIRELATKYSKPELARMVKMGMIEPQKALMAGMMIDRIAKSAMQPPQTTVAEDVMNPPMPTAAQGQIPQGIMGAPQAPAPSGGVATLPSGLQNMAGGGIVAFADGGTPEDMVRASRAADAALATLPQDDGLTLPGGLQFRQYNVPQPTNIKSEMSKEREALQEAGVDTEMYKRMREEEAGRRDELKGRREEAKGEALLMAGLGLMGARKGQEFQALSDVGRQAVQQYSGALREIRETEKDIKKAQRELLFAEDRAKRDMSAKSLARVDAKQKQIDDMEIRQTDLLNKAVEEKAKLNMEQYKVDKQTATQMAMQQLQSETSIKVAGIHEAGANKRAAAPDAQERIIANVLADLKKVNPNATFADAVQAVKGGAGVSGASLADKAYDNVMKRAQVDIGFQMQISKDPAALQAAIDAETRRLQGMTGGGQQGGSRPPTTFNLSPEAQKALQQYGGR